MGRYRTYSMRTIYINPEGKQVLRPKSLVIEGDTYVPPTDEQLIQEGWKIKEIIDPTPEPYIPTYEEKVVMLIRERYSLDSELAIQRQRDSKPEEFQVYFNYCEECKRRAKDE